MTLTLGIFAYLSFGILFSMAFDEEKKLILFWPVMVVIVLFIIASDAITGRRS